MVKIIAKAGGLLRFPLLLLDKKSEYVMITMYNYESVTKCDHKKEFLV